MVRLFLEDIFSFERWQKRFVVWFASIFTWFHLISIWNSNSVRDFYLIHFVSEGQFTHLLHYTLYPSDCVSLLMAVTEYYGERFAVFRYLSSFDLWNEVINVIFGKHVPTRTRFSSCASRRKAWAYESSVWSFKECFKIGIFDKMKFHFHEFSGDVFFYTKLDIDSVALNF